MGFQHFVCYLSKIDLDLFTEAHNKQAILSLTQTWTINNRKKKSRAMPIRCDKRVVGKFVAMAHLV